MFRWLFKLSIIMFFALCIAIAAQALWLPAEYVHLSGHAKSIVTIGLCVAFSITATAVMIWERL